MTVTTNARLAGFAYLVYIAAAMPSVILFERAAKGDAIAARLAGIAQHTTDIRVSIVLGLISAFAAVVLAVTLYAVTRAQDPDLALLGMACRIVEAVIVALSIESTRALLWLATDTSPNAPDAGAARALAGYFFSGEPALPATFFAAGSLLFSWLLLRGRMIPVALAWLGVVSSVVLVVALPIRLAGWLTGPITTIIWLPMLAFELVLGVWFLIKGVRT
jgi:hypothetical protein